MIGEKAAIEFKDYKQDMLEFYNKLDQHIVNEATKNSTKDNDLDKAIFTIWKIMGYNLFSLISDFPDKRKFYSIAGNARLILECLADSEYLVKNPDEAKKYWQNQDEIRSALLELNKNDIWQFIIDGKINEYGSLNEKTTKRIKANLNNNLIGTYNFLCFFVHPNAAGLSWMHNDDSVINPKFILLTITNALAQFIELLEKHTTFDIKSTPILTELDTIFSKLKFSGPTISL